MSRIRIKDIAEAAGVSPATVSRYLNNRPGQMTEDTRARIAEVIERTGYRPSTAARNLRSVRTHLVGVILADISNPYSSAMLESLSAAAAKRGCSLMTATSGNEAEAEADTLNRLVDAGVDGIVINTCGGNDELIAQVAAHVPLVLLDRDVAAGGIDLVTSNNDELVCGLLDELVGAHCTCMCMLTEQSDTSLVRRERATAFNAELKRRNLAGEVVTLADGGVEGTGKIDRAIIEAAGEKLGIISVNGLVFLRLTETLAQLGPSLPEGLQIATFDDYPWNRVLFGGVTTAAQDTDGIARAVIERLEQRIEATLGKVGESAALESQSRVIPGEIIVRASTR